MNRFRVMRTRFLLSCLLLAATTITHAQGIEFMHDLDSALTKAKVENKMVYIDFYTSWCGPCKVMDKEVFPQEKVGKFFNEKFVSCKVQCDDKGKGVILGEKYQVVAYPTSMFLDANGALVHTAAGAPSADGFLDLAKIALNPERNLMTVLKEWDAGNRNPEFVTKYFRALKSAYRYAMAKSDFESYFNGLDVEQKTSRHTYDLVLLLNSEPFSVPFTYLEDNKKKYYKTVGKEEVDKFIADRYLWHLKALLDTKNMKPYHEAMAKFKAKKYPFYKEYEMFYAAFASGDSTGGYDIKEYMRLGTEFLDKYGKNNDMYTLSLTSLLGNCTGRENESLAGIKWMEDLLARNRKPEYLNTYFYITWRNYHFEDALKIGNEIRENAIRANKSTQSIDRQITMVTEFRDKVAARKSAKM